jgi:hypothetical protein
MDENGSGSCLMVRFRTNYIGTSVSTNRHLVRS